MNLIHADCLDAMAAMDPESIDAIVTDPPYGLGFMGKAWDADFEPGDSAMRRNPQMDAVNTGASRQGGRQRYGDGYQKRQARDARTYQSWCEAWALEAYRIAKPGAHLLAFGGTRTVHRLAAAIEDAGWEIRDMLVWGYASGFPKSLDVSKAIDRAAGAERETAYRPQLRNDVYGDGKGKAAGVDRTPGAILSDPPATPDAEKWNGWGTALKPAWEPIVMARKPLRGTVAANVLRHGTGALNIAATRIGYESDADFNRNANFTRERQTPVLFGASSGTQTPTPGGRWPANVILTDPIFDGGVEGVVGGGPSLAGSGLASDDSGGWSGWSQNGSDGIGGGYGDAGTYSRFFLIPKSARAEREPIMPEGRRTSLAEARMDERDAEVVVEGNVPQVRTVPARANVHPTVKPLDLMRHLVRLVTPPGGTVLDPFLGSGTTALAAEMEGFAWIGIEKEADYIAITEARLSGTQRGLGI